MTKQSRLDAARAEQEAGGEWYRSPLVLVAGLLVFLGALALIVFGVTGGDDTAAPEETPPTAAATDNGGAADGATRAEAEVPAAADSSAPAIVFGGGEVLEVNKVTVVGDPLPPAGGGDDPAVGTLAPEVTAASLANGNPIALGPGRARVIGFFAHWCPHCQDELPDVTAWLADNELPPNTEFIAVSTAVDQGRDNYPPSAWFNEVGFAAPVLVDDANSTFLSSMGFSGFPAFVAVDASGVVVARAGGGGTEGLEALFANFASASASS